MKVKMLGLYGMNGTNAFFRKQGNYCFDFVSDEKLASDLSGEATQVILNGSDWYCKMFGADRLEIV